MAYRVVSGCTESSPPSVEAGQEAGQGGQGWPLRYLDDAGVGPRAGGRPRLRGAAGGGGGELGNGQRAGDLVCHPRTCGRPHQNTLALKAYLFTLYDFLSIFTLMSPSPVPVRARVVQ